MESIPGKEFSMSTPESTAVTAEASEAMSLGAALAYAEQRHEQRRLAGKQAAGLRALAAMIEQNPEISRMAQYYLTTLNVFSSRTPEDHATLARVGLRYGATVTKDVSADLYNLNLSFVDGAVVASALANREEVCEKVVTGVETVTKTIKDPAAVAALPDVEITEEVEKVSWVCKPLLAAGESEAVVR
jgi:hypothetical protein